MIPYHKPRVVHLIDDTTAGGVMRVIDHVISSPVLAKGAHHMMQRTERGKVSFQHIDAAVIVSHLSISWLTLPSLLALRLRHPSTKLVHVEHSYTRAFIKHNVTRKRRFLNHLKIGFRLFDKVVCVSDGQRQWMREDALVSEPRLALVRSYADLSEFAVLPAADGDIKHFGAIGRLDRQKGFDLLILAFRDCTDADLRLTFFGEGEEEENLRALAQGDSRIQFAGMATNPIEAYRAVDAVVMPSRWEAYGLVAIEAIGAGRALFCSDVDGLADHKTIGACVIDLDTFDFDKLKARAAAAGNISSEKRHQVVRALTTEAIEAWEGLIAA